MVKIIAKTKTVLRLLKSSTKMVQNYKYMNILVFISTQMKVSVGDTPKPSRFKIVCTLDNITSVRHFVKNVPK